MKHIKLFESFTDEHIISRNFSLNYPTKDLAKAEEKLNEIFGFSKKEREEKYYKEKLEQAKKEISNYNFGRIFRETSENSNNEDLRNLVDIALADASYSLPTVKLLMPDLFVRKGGGTNAMSANYNYKGEYINGIVPSNFYFLVQDQELMQDFDAKKRMEQELENFINW